MRNIWIVVMVAAFGLGALGACKSSVDSEKQRYGAVKDRLDALASKQPTLKADIQAKLVEFDRLEKEAEALKGDDAIKALQALVNRMDSYEKVMNPQTPPPAGSASSSKLGGPPPPRPTGSAPPPVTPPPPTAPATSGSGFGGK